MHLSESRWACLCIGAQFGTGLARSTRQLAVVGAEPEHRVALVHFPCSPFGPGALYIRQTP